MMRMIAIIPARGGSKGIPRKNIRLLHGLPLIVYAIRTAICSKWITDVIVTTDDEEIATIARNYGSKVIMRPPELATDEVTLDPVVFHAITAYEDKEGAVDIVITMQPTSPLLQAGTIDGAIETFMKTGYDTIISAVNKPHLAWGEQDGTYVPLYEKRLNRQYLPKHLLETGAFVITNRSFIKEHTRLGEYVNLYQVPEEESVDIDDFSDWIICEMRLNRKRIAIRTEGYPAIGLGHVYRSIMLYDNLIEHDALILISERSQLGIQKLRERNIRFEVIDNEQDFHARLQEKEIQILINDILDTSEAYMKSVKRLVPRVVNFEDMGEGGKWADAVINALYENVGGEPNYYWGERYYCLRDEFRMVPPKTFSESVHNILIAFGGTDPARYTEKILHLIEDMSGDDSIVYQFILGLGFDRDDTFYKLVDQTSKQIRVIKDVKMISAYMGQADIAISSQGRTMYELANMKVPTIVLAQNAREARHEFGDMRNGFINLGVGNDVDEKMIRETLLWLIHTPQIRKQMYENMGRLDLTQGIRRVKKIILGDETKK